jgi:hypothetical protein
MNRLLPGVVLGLCCSLCLAQEPEVNRFAALRAHHTVVGEMELPDEATCREAAASTEGATVCSAKQEVLPQGNWQLDIAAFEKQGGKPVSMSFRTAHQRVCEGMQALYQSGENVVDEWERVSVTTPCRKL